MKKFVVKWVDGKKYDVLIVDNLYRLDLLKENLR